MDSMSFLVLFIYYLFYLPPSYWVLKKCGVESGIVAKSLQFGLVLLLLQFALPIGMLIISLNYGFIIGSVFGVVFSYIYVSRVLVLKWYKTIAIILLLPIAAGLLSAPVMYAWYFLLNA